MNKFCQLGLFILCLASAVSATPPEHNLRVGVNKVNITPGEPTWFNAYRARQSEGVHDSLYHRILILDDGSTQFYLISSDLSAIRFTIYKRLCDELNQRYGIEPYQVWWAATHTHAAPMVGPRELLTVMRPWREWHPPNPDYSEFVLRELIDGIEQARQKMEPARLGIGTGMSFANINRRAEDVDGSISLGYNPDRPVDRQIGVLRFERPDRTLIATVANYAIHGTVTNGRNMLVGGDVPGIVAEYVEQQTGALLLFINGAAGNIAPLYSGTMYDGHYGHITEFNVTLGDKIIEAGREIGKSTERVRLALDRRFIETPKRPGFGWVESLDEYLRVTSTGDTLVRVPISYLKINRDVAIWSAPVELFCQIAMNVRNRSPFLHTFYFGYANGALGYLPVRSAFSEGGYEANRVTPFTPAVEDNITQGVLTYLWGILE